MAVYRGSVGQRTGGQQGRGWGSAGKRTGVNRAFSIQRSAMQRTEVSRAVCKDQQGRG
ncbi:unnamed protein product [Staurois parvus]|uniref:Uncharacterized protein n=1 Tax=Staurois parvus TaxID=386267 RepID=A0ABN9BNQ8_9NEOB|nr:unnamed protein product [Staurois parvus]